MGGFGGQILSGPAGGGPLPGTTVGEIPPGDRSHGGVRKEDGVETLCCFRLFRFSFGCCVTPVLAWTSAGTATERTITGLSLETGQTYYVSVKAQNGQGLWSEVGSSDGITVSAEETEKARDSGVPFWVWILVALGVVGVGAGGFVLSWRKARAR